MFPAIDLPGCLAGLFKAQLSEAAKIEEIVNSFKKQGGTEQQIEGAKTKALNASQNSIRSYRQCLEIEFEACEKKHNGAI